MSWPATSTTAPIAAMIVISQIQRLLVNVSQPVELALAPNEPPSGTLPL